MSTIAMAEECLQSQDLDLAEAICRSVIKKDAGDARAWHLIGIVHAQRGQLDPAKDCFTKACKLDPADSLFPYNLALANAACGQHRIALDHYRTAIGLRDDFEEAWANLGNTLVRLRRHREAMQCFRDAVERFPDSADAHFNLANSLQSGKLTDEAATHYRRAIELNPELDAARENLGRGYSDAGRVDEARAVWEQWLADEPDCELAAHLLAALSPDASPDRCSDQTVRQTFNEDFAKSFDEQLAKLDYRTPQLMEAAIASLDLPTGDLAVLDAGCGTGLCGDFLRPFAGRLVGVDLSSAMLRRAFRRSSYDELIEQELTAYLQQHTAEFDVIVISDTLCYFGDLRAVLTAVRESLKPEGAVVFSVEQHEAPESAAGFQLQPNGRYHHSESYVRDAVTAVGLRLHHLTAATQRRELGQDVVGLIATALRGRDGG